MKIGIIIYSKTGNTLSVAEKLKTQLELKGHTVIIDKVIPINDTTDAATPVLFKVIPDASAYDSVVFCSFVAAFSLNPVMTAYLKQMPYLNGEKTALFLTQFFPFKWMGGNHALAQMKKICMDKKAQVTECGIVNWKNKKREEQIEELIERIVELY